MTNMTTNSATQWPNFAPINITFDKEKMFNEIKQSGILKNIKVATTHAVDSTDRGFWDNGVNFSSIEFEKQKDIPLWQGEGESRTLCPHKINTFYQVNMTTPDPEQNDLKDSWIGQHQTSNKTPLWVAFDKPWQYRTDCELPYLQSVVEQLGLEYVSMIRLVYQTPPSIGVIHRDSGPKTNGEYYANGGVTITLNVSSGGGNLYFIDNNGNERTIDEEAFSVWHFDDGRIHCTNEINSERVQVRIYGHHKYYKDLMDLSQAIY